MSEKRYYWIKLKTNFFEQETIDFLMSQKNGCQYIVLYQMLCLKTANTDGKLCSKIGEMIVPYDVNKIVRDTKYFDFDTVTVALELFKQLGLIYIETDDNTLQIANYGEMVGSETSSAKRVREYRAKQKALQCNNDVTQENRDKSIDNRDKDIKSIKNKYGEFQNVLLTDEEFQKVSEQGLLDILEELSGYIASSGKNYKSHYATILNWSRRKEKEAQSKKPGKLKSKPTYDLEEIKKKTIFDDNYDI